MEHFEDTPHPRTQAGLDRAVQHRTDFEDTTDIFNKQLKEKEAEVSAAYADLEKGKQFKKTLTDENLLVAAESSETATLERIVGLERERDDIKEKIEGTKRSLN